MADENGMTTFKKSFLEGIAGGAVLLAIVAGWLLLRADDTAQKLQSLVPVKTAIIEVPEKQDQKSDMGHVVSKTSKALTLAPINGMFETVGHKTLPIIRKNDGMAPFDAYKKPFVLAEGQTPVAIVVVGYGLLSDVSNTLLKTMPENTTLSLSPYSETLTDSMNKARETGHEVWISLPMERQDAGGGDSGPLTILSGVTEAQNLDRLMNVLSSVQGYAGLVSEPNSIIPSMENVMAPLAKEIVKRGLAYADSNVNIVPSVLKSFSDSESKWFVQNNLWIDSDLEPTATEGILKTALQKAARNGRVVLFMHPYPALVERVARWEQELKDKNMTIVPLSYMIDHP